MPGWQLSPRAQADLDDIADYTFSHWGAAQTDRYIRGLEGAFSQLVEDAWRGRTASERYATVFRYNFGSHIIIFERSGDGVDIVRVLHNKMDVDAHLP